MPLYGEEKRKYQRDWIRARRDSWIESQGGKCVECGSTESLEVDHIDRTTKTMAIGAAWNRTAAIREAELAKCQVLCTDCHKKKTKSEVEGEHGRVGRYNRGCRCDKCKAASRLKRQRTHRRAKLRKLPS